MGDYLLDFRQPGRRIAAAEEFLVFLPDLEIDCIQRPGFRLFLTREGAAKLWAPYVSPDGITVALSGRIAIDATEWQEADALPGEGGAACKAIYRRLQRSGFPAVEELNGSFAIHIFEPSTSRYSLILDPAGCYPSYAASNLRQPVISSHPDALAIATESSSDWDEVSQACFLAAGQVPDPCTYYRSIASLRHGVRYTIDLSGQAAVVPRRQEFASFVPIEGKDEATLAQELAAALGNCVRQITQPVLGTTFIALSGGLDSRLIAHQALKHDRLRAFSIRGIEKNSEFRTACAVSNALGIPMTPMVRSFDHYAEHAAMGVCISGGMGSISSNHFLGFRKKLRELGCDNFVTGCYFDYMFKSLSVDTEESRLLRREHLTDYRASSYLPYFSPLPAYEASVRERLAAVIPEGLASDRSEVGRRMIAARRTFPLWREGDNIQRLIAQRVFGWYSPAVFREVLVLYWQISIMSRLNKSLFRKVVLSTVPEALLAIPDINTGLRVDASPLLLTLFRYRIALRRLLERHSHHLDTDEAWLNWGYYLRRSSMIRELWCRGGAESRELIARLTGRPFSEHVETYVDLSSEYFVRLLTLNLWAQQRRQPAVRPVAASAKTARRPPLSRV